ncbi:MAG: hypothetical protein ABI866_12305 [Dokdonella sp.]
MSMKLRKVLTICAMACAVLLCVWAFFRIPHRQHDVAADAGHLTVADLRQTSSKDQNALIASVANLKKKPLSRVQSASELPALPPAGRPDLIIEVMRPYAELGSVQAMKYLSDGLQTCANVKDLPDPILEREAVDYVARFLEFTDLVGQKVDADAMKAEAAQGLELQKSAREACLSVGVEESMRWIDWLENAANAGDADAMRNYLYRALVDYHSAGDAALYMDEVRRRKERAFGYGRELLASGDCGHLQQMAIYAPTPLDAAIYMIATSEQGKQIMIASGEPDLNNSLQIVDAATQATLARLGIQYSSNIRDAANHILNTYCGS